MQQNFNGQVYVPGGGGLPYESDGDARRLA